MTTRGNAIVVCTGAVCLLPLITTIFVGGPGSAVTVKEAFVELGEVAVTV